MIFDLSNVDLDFVASKSLRNCHATGVDSLVFQDTPGAIIRAFVCRPEHELWMNCPSLQFPLAVALHPHHCDVILAPIYGDAYNVTHELECVNEILQAYKYESAITGTGGKFTRLGFSRGFKLVKSLIDRPVSMKAREIHTIYVPKDEGAAWFVLEGAENPRYNPIAYSNHNLEGLDFSGMYQSMTAAEVEPIIHKLRAFAPQIEFGVSA